MRSEMFLRSFPQSLRSHRATSLGPMARRLLVIMPRPRATLGRRATVPPRPQISVAAASVATSEGDLAAENETSAEVIVHGEEEGREEEGHEEEGCEEEEVSRILGPGTSSGDWSARTVGQSPSASRPSAVDGTALRPRAWVTAIAPTPVRPRAGAPRRHSWGHCARAGRLTSSSCIATARPRMGGPFAFSPPC